MLRCSVERWLSGCGAGPEERLESDFDLPLTVLWDRITWDHSVVMHLGLLEWYCLEGGV